LEGHRVSCRVQGCLFLGAVAILLANVAPSKTAGAQSATSATTRPQLEFNVSPEEEKGITGFVVGYFLPGQPTPVYTFPVDRSQIETPKPGVMRIPLIVGKLPPGQVYEVKLKTQSRRARSEWSAASGQFTVPADGGAPPLRPAAAPAKRSNANASRTKASARSAVTELKNNPEMASALSKRFPDIELSEAATGFTTVRDLATALFVASNLKVPFADVKRLTAGAGNRDVKKAIAELKPDADARAEEQKALKASRQTIRPVNKKRQ
jgi:hypothetical protein